MSKVSSMANYKFTDSLRLIDSFRAADLERENLIKELVEKNNSLLQEKNELVEKCLSELNSRQEYQSKIDQEAYKKSERSLNSSSFVLALIDGDGAIFQDSLLKAAGNDGGSIAASALHAAIRTHISSIYKNTENWSIVVQIYLSCGGLASTLYEKELLSHSKHLWTFAQHFGINQPLFSIVDVGYGKERADHKMKEMLRAFSGNPTCRQIIFGGCHDTGYISFLDQYKHDKDKAGRITLLETTPPHWKFTELPNFQRAKFANVFREEPLPESGPGNNTAASAAQVPQPPANFLLTKRSLTGSAPLVVDFPALTSNPLSSTSATSIPATDSSDDLSWTNVCKGRNTREDKISIAPIVTTNASSKKTYAYYNRNQQRLDEPLPTRDRASIEALDSLMKKKGKKMCNNYHLCGTCHLGSSCLFQHDPKLSKGEQIALRYKARGLACSKRFCEDIDCYFGHQCANYRDLGGCHYGFSCHMYDTHSMDMKATMKVDRNGNVLMIA